MFTHVLLYQLKFWWLVLILIYCYTVKSVMQFLRQAFVLVGSMSDMVQFLYCKNRKRLEFSNHLIISVSWAFDQLRGSKSYWIILEELLIISDLYLLYELSFFACRQFLSVWLFDESRLIHFPGTNVLTDASLHSVYFFSLSCFCIYCIGREIFIWTQISLASNWHKM